MFNRKDAAVRLAVLFTTLACIVWGVVASPGLAVSVQAVDLTWHNAMASREWPPLVGLAMVLAWIGSTWVTGPFRVLVLLWLWRRKLWTQLLVWVLAVVPAQLTTTFTKVLYSRVRPDDGLMDAFGTSFPSGHATNAAVIGLTLVFIFAAPGVRRWRWIAVAVGWALLMAWSRTYLRVHWLSDVTAGLLSGTSWALWSALLAPLSFSSADRRQSAPPSGLQ